MHWRPRPGRATRMSLAARQVPPQRRFVALDCPRLSQFKTRVTNRAGSTLSTGNSIGLRMRMERMARCRTTVASFAATRKILLNPKSTQCFSIRSNESGKHDHRGWCDSVSALRACLAVPYWLYYLNRYGRDLGRVRLERIRPTFASAISQKE